MSRPQPYGPMDALKTYHVMYSKQNTWPYDAAMFVFQWEKLGIRQSFSDQTQICTPWNCNKLKLCYIIFALPTYRATYPTCPGMDIPTNVCVLPSSHDVGKQVHARRVVQSNPVLSRAFVISHDGTIGILSLHITREIAVKLFTWS